MMIVAQLVVGLAAAAISIVRLFDRMAPREIARNAFILVSIGMVVLASVMNNEWGTPAVIAGLILVGLG